MSEKKDLKETILGEDGKLDLSDAKRLADEAVEGFKESKIGKAVLGEDGKFDGEDAKRIAEDVKEGAENLLNMAKDLLKKDE